MKKIYLILSLVAIAGFSFGQRAVGTSKPINATLGTNSSQRLVSDTITEHFAGGTPTIYSSQGGGFVAGHNAYMDLGKMMLFEMPQAGYSVTEVLYWFGYVTGNPSSVVTATIYADNAGEPGAVLATQTIPYSAIDTTMAGLQVIDANAAFNAKATFTNPVAIPSDNKFWAGITFTYNSTDTIGLVSTTDPEYALAATNTWEEWSDNTYHSFNGGSGTWQLDIALGIFPSVTFGIGTKELKSNFNVAQNQPNPFTGSTAIQYELAAASSDNSLKIFDVTGKVVYSENLGSKAAGQHNMVLNLDLNAGVYFYTIASGDVVSSPKRMVKN